MKLKKAQRNQLIREAHEYRRQRGAWFDDVADFIQTKLFEREVEYGLGGCEAIEISDYAYSLARFVVPKEEWF